MRIEVHDHAAAPQLHEWTDVVEPSFEVVGGHVYFANWGGQALLTPTCPPQRGRCAR